MHGMRRLQRLPVHGRPAVRMQRPIQDPRRCTGDRRGVGTAGARAVCSSGRRGARDCVDVQAPGSDTGTRDRCGLGACRKDALEGTGPQRRLGRRLQEVAKAVGGRYCRLYMLLTLALGVRGTVA